MSLAQALDEPSKASVSLREGPQRGALHHSSPRLREAGLPSCQWAAFATRGPRRMAHLLTPMADGPWLTTIWLTTSLPYDGANSILIQQWCLYMKFWIQIFPQPGSTQPHGLSWCGAVSQSSRRSRDHESKQPIAWQHSEPRQPFWLAVSTVFNKLPVNTLL